MGFKKRAVQWSDCEHTRKRIGGMNFSGVCGDSKPTDDGERGLLDIRHVTVCANRARGRVTKAKRKAKAQVRNVMD